MATKTPNTPKTGAILTPEDRARMRVKDFTDVMWHVAAFVIINVFMWVLVPQAAGWITFFWGFALAFHVAYYFIGDDGPQNRRYQAFLAQERAREKKANE